MRRLLVLALLMSACAKPFPAERWDPGTVVADVADADGLTDTDADADAEVEDADIWDDVDADADIDVDVDADAEVEVGPTDPCLDLSAVAVGGDRAFTRDLYVHPDGSGAVLVGFSRDGQAAERTGWLRRYSWDDETPPMPATPTHDDFVPTDSALYAIAPVPGTTDFVVTGEVGTDPEVPSLWVARLDANGAVVWSTHEEDTTHGKPKRGRAVAVTAAFEVLVGASHAPTNGANAQRHVLFTYGLENGVWNDIRGISPISKNAEAMLMVSPKPGFWFFGGRLRMQERLEVLRAYASLTTLIGNDVAYPIFEHGGAEARVASARDAVATADGGIAVLGHVYPDSNTSERYCWLATYTTDQDTPAAPPITFGSNADVCQRFQILPGGRYAVVGERQNKPLLLVVDAAQGEVVNNDGNGDLWDENMGAWEAIEPDPSTGAWVLAGQKDISPQEEPPLPKVLLERIVIDDDGQLACPPSGQP